MGSRTFVLATALAACCALAPQARAADAERGRVLYETNCGGCHATSVHGREKRAAADFDGVRAWVRRWSANLGRAWSADEVDDVSVYLNFRFYRFPCPPGVCRATGLNEATGRSLAEIGPPARAGVP